MTVPAWLWIATIAALLAVIAVDFYLVARNPRDPSLRESTIWISCYVALAVLFGAPQQGPGVHPRFHRLVSLGVIIAALAVTTVTSLISSRRTAAKKEAALVAAAEG